MVDNGENIRAKDSFGNTLLYIAIMNRRSRLFGAYKSIEMTALHCAGVAAAENMGDVLVEYGDVHASDLLSKYTLMSNVFANFDKRFLNLSQIAA